MAFYNIAQLTVSMQPLYEQVSSTSEKFKTDGLSVPPAQIVVPYTEEYYKKWLVRQPHLTLSDAENICTANFFASSIIHFDGIVLHASAILFDGGAYLFSADSGIGKTTHTKLWRQYYGQDRVKILNDDKPALRLIGGRFYAFGTPWCGNSRECENLVAPLRAIVFLERGTENRITQMTNTSQVLASLLAQTVHRTSAGKLSLVLDFADTLLKNIPFYNLSCTMDQEAVKIASEAIVY